MTSLSQTSGSHSDKNNKIPKAVTHILYETTEEHTLQTSISYVVINEEIIS
jgi:hypothetical protein